MEKAKNESKIISISKHNSQNGIRQGKHGHVCLGGFRLCVCAFVCFGFE